MLAKLDLCSYTLGVQIRAIREARNWVKDYRGIFMCIIYVLFVLFEIVVHFSCCILKGTGLYWWLKNYTTVFSILAQVNITFFIIEPHFKSITDNQLI
jgi:hypothetical protein